MAGRHPGHYFMGEDSISTDVVHADAVCRKRVNSTTNDDLSINRAGAISEYVGPAQRGEDGTVVVCGGRNEDGEVLKTCVAYTPKTMVTRQVHPQTFSLIKVTNIATFNK